MAMIKVEVAVRTGKDLVHVSAAPWRIPQHSEAAWVGSGVPGLLSQHQFCWPRGVSHHRGSLVSQLLIRTTPSC